MLGVTSPRSTAWSVSAVTEPYRLIWTHRELLFQVAKTTLLQRHAGSLLGALWLVAGPLLLLVTYAYMFVVIFGARPPSLTTGQYVTHMFCGLVLLLTTSQGLSTATSSLAQEPGLLFNQVFPAELFPIREVLAATPLLFIGLIVAPIWALEIGSLSWAWLLLPLLLVLTMMTLIGCAWVLSLANLVVRDTPQILAYVLTLLMLTSPIAYEASMLPKSARLLVALNPFAYFVTAFQDIIVHGRAPGPWLLAGIAATGLITFHGAYALFKRGKSVIAENI